MLHYTHVYKMEQFLHSNLNVIMILSHQRFHWPDSFCIAFLSISSDVRHQLKRKN